MTTLDVRKIAQESRSEKITRQERGEAKITKEK